MNAPGGIESVDRTMALKLRRGGRSGKASRARSDPTLEVLQDFGRDVCGVHHPAAVVARVQEGMRQALALAERNSAVPPTVMRLMAQAWEAGGLS
ncbi:MAG: hypothetical protein ABIQ90_14175 [Polaromonas sp.]